MLRVGFNFLNSLLKLFRLKLIHVEDGTAPDRLCKSLKHFDIDTVFDVGSNTGQFAADIRRSGFSGRIISFEPLPDAHNVLGKRAGKDSNWIIHARGALGDYDGQAVINVAENSLSSSILDMTDAHSDADGKSRYTASEKIDIQKLDSVANQYLKSDTRGFLKIDTQGFEENVLDGALNTLPRLRGVLLETSLVELYKGQRLWIDMIKRLEDEGFSVWSVDRGFTDLKNGRTLQCDVAFFRTEIIGP